jgi:hypothetical protein
MGLALIGTRCAEISITSSARDTCADYFTLPPFVGDGLYAVTFYKVGKMYHALRA